MATYTILESIPRKMNGKDGMLHTVALAPEGVGVGHDEVQQYFVSDDQVEADVLQAAADNLEAGWKEIIANAPPMLNPVV